jgi:hypothetical protein
MGFPGLSALQWRDLGTGEFSWWSLIYYKRMKRPSRNSVRTETQMLLVVVDLAVILPLMKLRWEVHEFKVSLDLENPVSKKKK